MIEDLARQLEQYDELFLIYDENVEQWADALAGEAHIDACMSIEASEQTKDIDTVMDICRFLLAMDADRGATVIALGGGVTTDMVAFAASIYKRGVRCILIPTTLLAMVDAALGGKTGVNLDGFKNMIGTFAPAERTYIDTCFLETLSRRELLCGAAEMIKTFIIEDTDDHYERAIRLFSAPSLDMEELRSLIDASDEVKKAIVSRDPLERGERRKLNLGHTWGHAIEWYERTHGVRESHNHGEAVAMGIVAAARHSAQRGICPESLASKIAADIKSCGLPTELPYPMEDLQQAIAKDKKNIGGEPRYVLIRAIGDITI